MIGKPSGKHKIYSQTDKAENEVSRETKSETTGDGETFYRVRVTPRWHVVEAGRPERSPGLPRKVLRTGEWLLSASGRRDFPAFWRKVVGADQWLMFASADRERDLPDFLRGTLDTGDDGRPDESIELVVDQRGLDELGLHAPEKADTPEKATVEDEAVVEEGPLRDWLAYRRWLDSEDMPSRWSDSDEDSVDGTDESRSLAPDEFPDKGKAPDRGNSPRRVKNPFTGKVPVKGDPSRDWLAYSRWLNSHEKPAEEGGKLWAVVDSDGEVTGVEQLDGPFMSGALPPESDRGSMDGADEAIAGPSTTGAPRRDSDQGSANGADRSAWRLNPDLGDDFGEMWARTSSSS